MIRLEINNSNGQFEIKYYLSAETDPDIVESIRDKVFAKFIKTHFKESPEKVGYAKQKAYITKSLATYQRMINKAYDDVIYGDDYVEDI